LFGLEQLENWRTGELENWRIGKTGELEDWRGGALEDRSIKDLEHEGVINICSEASCFVYFFP
jgi:hypothetical protein